MMLPLCFALGLAVAGSAFSPADAGHPAPRFYWNIPDIISSVEVPGVQYVDGTPVRFHTVTSKRRAADLVPLIVRSFHDAGLYVPPPEHQLQLDGRRLQVTALDPDSLTSYTAILKENPDKTTLVILGESKLSRPTRAAAEDFAPLFPGATEVLRTQLEGARTITFATTATEKEVKDFYQEALTKSGYRETSHGNFRRGKNQITLQITRPKDRPGFAVLLMFRMLGANED